MDFDGEDDDGADGGDGIGDHQRDVGEHDALNHKQHRPESEHQEGRKRDAIRVACAYRPDRLRQIAKDHADRSRIANYI